MESEKSITDVFRAKKFALCFTPVQMSQADLSRLTPLALTLTASVAQRLPSSFVQGR